MRCRATAGLILESRLSSRVEDEEPVEVVSFSSGFSHFPYFMFCLLFSSSLFCVLSTILYVLSLLLCFCCLCAVGESERESAETELSRQCIDPAKFDEIFFDQLFSLSRPDLSHHDNTDTTPIRTVRRLLTPLLDPSEARAGLDRLWIVLNDLKSRTQH